MRVNHRTLTKRTLSGLGCAFLADFEMEAPAGQARSKPEVADQLRGVDDAARLGDDLAPIGHRGS